MRGAAIIVTALVLLLAACGGSGGSGTSPRLDAASYKHELKLIKQQAAAAQAHVALGLHAKSLPELRQRLEAFANSTGKIGDEVAKLNPPQNAEAANTELAKGLKETARATHSASQQIAKLHSPQEAISYLEQSPANAKGAHEVDEALRKLRKLGYTSGS